MVIWSYGSFVTNSSGNLTMLNESLVVEPILADGIASGDDIKPCNNIDIPLSLVVCIFFRLRNDVYYYAV